MNQKLELVLNLLKDRYGDRFLDYIEGATLRRDLNYDDYIKIETLLSIQKPITDYHDDMALLLRARNRVLVQPSSATCEKLSGLFEYTII